MEIMRLLWVCVLHFDSKVLLEKKSRSKSGYPGESPPTMSVQHDLGGWGGQKWKQVRGNIEDTSMRGVPFHGEDAHKMFLLWHWQDFHRQGQWCKTKLKLHTVQNYTSHFLVLGKTNVKEAGLEVNTMKRETSSQSTEMRWHPSGQIEMLPNPNYILSNCIFPSCVFQNCLFSKVYPAYPGWRLIQWKGKIGKLIITLPPPAKLKCFPRNHFEFWHQQSRDLFSAHLINLDANTDIKFFTKMPKCELYPPTNLVETTHNYLRENQIE